MAVPHWLQGLRLVVVDEAAAGEFVAALESSGIRVTECVRGADALIAFGRVDPHAVLIGPVLTDMSAVDTVAAMRRQGTQPILVGVGPGDAEPAGPILMAGATAAVARPYRTSEVVAWLARELPDLPSQQEPLTFGPLTLNPLAHTVHIGDRELDQLPLKEFQLLRLLMTHADHVVPLQQMKTTVWSQASQPTNNTVAVHAQRLRRRLPDSLELIMVRGIGYRLTRAASAPRPPAERVPRQPTAFVPRSRIRRSGRPTTAASPPS